MRYYYKKDNNYLSLKHSLEIIDRVEDGVDEDGNIKYKEVRSLPEGYIEVTEAEFETNTIKPVVISNEVKEELEVKKQIASLKQELASYDYIGVKIAMGVATKEEYAKEIAHTEELRKQIRKLEAKLA